MKLLYVTAQFPFGAVESFLGPEVAALRAQGVDIEIAPLRRPGQRREGTDTMPLTPEASVARLIADTVRTMFRQPRDLWRICAVIARDRKHMVKNLLVLPSAISLARRVRAASSDHVHAHWLSTSGTAAWVVSRLTGVPFSITAHRWDILDANLIRTKAQEAQFIRAISEAGRSDIALRAPDCRRLITVHMGVPQREPKGAAPAHLGPGLRMVCPAFLTPVKGHRYLITAMAQCPDDVELVLAGTGPERDALIAQTKSLGLENRVRFAGLIPHQELLASYDSGRFNTVVLPSLHEGIPVSLMEAMVRGVPVIATDVGGVGELVESGVSGLVVAPRDPEALASSIRRLAQDVGLRRGLSAGGRSAVTSGFVADACAAALLREMVHQN